MVEESIVFRPNIPDRDVDREVRKVDQQLQDAGTINPEIGDVRGDVDLGSIGGGGLGSNGPGSPLRAMSGGMQDLVPMADYRNRLLEDILDGKIGSGSGGGGGGALSRIRDVIGSLLGRLGLGALGGAAVSGAVSAGSLITGTIGVGSLITGTVAATALVGGTIAAGELVEIATGGEGIGPVTEAGRQFGRENPQLASTIHGAFTSPFNPAFRAGQATGDILFGGNVPTRNMIANQQAGTSQSLPDPQESAQFALPEGMTGKSAELDFSSGRPRLEPVNDSPPPRVNVNNSFNLDPSGMADLERQIDDKLNQTKRDVMRETESNMSAGGRP